MSSSDAIIDRAVNSQHVQGLDMRSAHWAKYFGKYIMATLIGFTVFVCSCQLSKVVWQLLTADPLLWESSISLQSRPCDQVTWVDVATGIDCARRLLLGVI